MPVKYEFLSAEQQEHFFKHGWIKIPNAINKKYIDAWLNRLWIRLGWDKDAGPRGWEGEYVKFVRHEEVPFQEFAPDAYKACMELCGGEDRVDPIRNMRHGDHFIINNGSDYWETHDCDPKDRPGWHTDNDWYRQFLDSSNNALVVIHLFTDVPPRGGGTFLCEDGIAGIEECFYKHKQGLDSPFTNLSAAHVKNCKVFSQVSGKAGDTFILHPYIPHTNGPNHLRTPRIITNPHVTLKEPFNLDRDDPSDYSLIERVILDRLGRDRIPESEYRDPSVPRISYYPRNLPLRTTGVPDEIRRLQAAAEASGKGKDSIYSIWLDPEGPDMQMFKRNFGLDLPEGPNHGVVG
ncbi:hypothetical protein CALCODRAFT_438776 [Calocera cornea HHB12733]|uniref:Phytanoyl-CoA dioxygenase n=1 Tax=Calocera cornea HHB12733 TaxID=1353952 RepID=A0A165E944_9BASI|nr:hypothetical protein CALCODRAFT_438776 [Calocera cornea HHB12733]